MSRLRLALILLAVPVVALLVARGLQERIDSRWREFLTLRRGAVPPAMSSVHRVCARPEFASRGGVCDTLAYLTLMERGAAGAGIAGILLVVAVSTAGRAARNNRRLLVSLFKPGLYITILTVAGLIVAQATLVIATIYYGNVLPTKWVREWTSLAVGLTALFGAFAMLRAASGMVTRPRVQVVGTIVTAETQPRFTAFVGNLARQVAAPIPQHIVVGLAPGFFVTEDHVVCLDGDLRGRTLYFSLPLCRILRQDELRAIVGHELGHFRDQDTQYSQRFYPIYRRAQESLAAIGATADSSFAYGIVLMPATASLSYFLEAFAVAESAVSRERELAADRVGVAASNSQGLAAAMVKLHAFAGLWYSVLEGAQAALKEQKQFDNMSAVFAELARDHANPEALHDLDSQRIPHPVDLHPPLSVRLDALGTSVTAVQEAALALAPSDAAIELIDNYETLERALTDVEHSIIYQENQPAAQA